ncbi:MAG: DNA polymerase III subunit beta [Anaerolineales bacterium]|nr:DNA polymerase III subunit beta [Anaerolineales bacterium]
MKVSCLQENLSKGLSIVSRAVAARSTLPVLGNILVATDNGRLKLSATNLELSITCWIGAKIEAEGATTVPAKTFVDLVNTLPQDKVELDLNPRTQTLNLACGRTRAHVKGIDAAEFPQIPQADADHALELNVEDLREMIGQVTFAAATDEARPILTGVMARIDGVGLKLEAADGFRLAVRTAHLSSPAAAAVNAVIPARALAELARLITADEPVHMSLPPGRGQVIFQHGSIELVSQLIEGAFPDLTPVIPKTYTTRAVLPTDEFRKACRTSDIFAREAAHTARIKIKPGSDDAPGHVSISATSAETGDNQAEIDASVEGGAVEISFNVKYLVDVLNVITTPNVALEVSSPTSPGVIRPVTRDDYLYVAMPMHIGK